MKGYKEFAKKAEKKGKDRKTESARKELKANMAELRGKLKSRGEERERQNEMAKVVKMYQEGGEEKMNQYLFEESESKTRLTQEQLKSDPKAREYLKKMFSPDSLGQTFDDFLVSLPTEQDYVENITEKIKRSSAGLSNETELTEADMLEVQKQPPSSKIITSEDAKEVSGEINNAYKLSKETNKNVISRATHEAAKMKEFESDLQSMKESRAEEAQTAYVKAYREYDPRFTKNKPDDLIAVTRPPFFAFGSAARELKRLHGAMVKARENRASRDDSKKIKENLAKSKIRFNDEAGLTPEARKAIKLSARKEEEEFIESNKGLAPK